MPWKNPKCEKCGAKTKRGKIIDSRRCFYVCRFCGHSQIGWRHEKRRIK